MTNKERRDLGMAYRSDSEVLEEQKRTRRLVHELNTTDPSDFSEIARLAKAILGKSERAFMNPPFYCDYGFHIETGKGFFANYNCTILDVGKVTFGDSCKLGPNVSVYAAAHPIHPAARNSFYECGAGVTVGDNVWIGGNTVILPGVTIGSNTVIGAGSVVTKDIPAWRVAAGNPCRVLREITEEDMKYYFKDQVFDPEAWEEVKKTAEEEKM